MKREIDYRQAVYVNGKFDSFHYWGFLDQHSDGKFVFVSPMALSNSVGMKTDPMLSDHYTGLKDRNGVKVYEGDVNEDGGVVIWNASDASFCWDYPNLEVMSMGDEQTWCKVTGNIHESGGGEG